VYFDDSVTGTVHAEQSPTGAVGLSGFTGVVQIGTAPLGDDVATIASGGSFARPTLRIAYASESNDIYEVAVSSGSGGHVSYEISDSGGSGSVPTGAAVVIDVPNGKTIDLTATADAGFAFDRWTGSSTSVGAAITADAAGSYAATWTTASTGPSPAAYTISVAVDGNSTATPSGSVSVAAGTNKTIVFAAKSGYEIADVVIDGASVPSAIAAGSYTFSSVSSNHSISITSKASVPTPGGDPPGGGDDAADDDGKDDGISAAAIAIAAAVIILAVVAVAWFAAGHKK
jgi:hypothetical protein